MSEPDDITWIYAGGGNDLYNEFLRSDLKMPNVVAFLQPIDFEEPLGWFKKPIGRWPTSAASRCAARGWGPTVVATYNSRMRAPDARMVEHSFGKP
jgi:hypothetical protein